MVRQSATSGVKDAAGTSKPPAAPKVDRPCNLDGLPSGLMGKLLLYKSGAVKLKLGDTLYDVSIAFRS